MTNIRVFGALGTEVHVDARRYEIVALDEGSVITWRSKCEACAMPIFVTSKEGRLPTGRHCTAHVGKRTKVGDVAEVSDEEARRLQQIYPTGLIPVNDMIPPFVTNVANLFDTKEMIKRYQERKDRFSAQDGGVYGENPLLPSYTETMPTSVIPEEENYTPARPAVVGEDASLTQSLYDELAELESEESTLPPEPDPQKVWGERLKLYRIQRMWLPTWGPRPGHEGCEAPPEMLEHGW